MREEIAGLEACAESVLADGGDPSGAVGAALAELRTNRAQTEHTADVRAEYALASEVLSRSLEAGLAAGGELAARVRGVLEQRLARELQIRGGFALVGR
jgi:hypothetical protein